jgi:glycosyltransferase involved in cell wall biosynthesis
MAQQGAPVSSFPRSPDADAGANARDSLPALPGIEIWRTADRCILKSQVLRTIARFAPYRRIRARRSVVQSADATTTALVIDPALLMEGGHNYSALLRVKGDLSKLGVEHTSFASVTADPVVRQLAAPVLPTKGLWWRSHYTHSEFRQHVRAMRDQLSLALNDQKRPPDLLVLSCCDSVQVRAVAEYYAQPSQMPPPHLLLWLLFRPNGFKPMGDLSAAEQIDEYREAFAALRRAIGDNSKITVVCETAELATAYRDIIGLDVGVAPSPNLAGAAGRALRPKREPASKIVTLGHANEAKGYRLLPEAIRHVLDSDGRATFFIHGTLQNSDMADGATLFDVLSRMGPRVLTSNEVLTSSEYLAQLLEADILLLPYDREIYEARGSGLFNEAREIGIPVVATRGCAFAQPAFDEGWGVEIVDHSAAGLAQALLAALKRLPHLSALAAKARAHHHADDIRTILRKVVGDIRADERSVRAGAIKARRWQPFPDTFFTGMSLQNGASVRDEAWVDAFSSVSTQQHASKPAMTLMLGRLVETTSMPYHYSVVLSIDAGETRKLPAGSHLVAEISIEVIAGKVSIVWIDENFEVLDEMERYAPAMEGVQRLVVPVPADQAYGLVFRNFAPTSVPTSFRLLELRAMKLTPNLTERTLRRRQALRQATRSVSEATFSRNQR